MVEAYRHTSITLRRTVDSDPKIPFLLHGLQEILTYVVCAVAVSGPKVHYFTRANVERYLPLVVCVGWRRDGS